MTIAYLDVLHDLRFTRPGSRRHEEFKVASPVPVEIRDLSPPDVEHVATLSYDAHPDKRIHAWEGVLLAPVHGMDGQPLTLDSLSGPPSRHGTMLGRAYDWRNWALHGSSQVPKRADLPVGRVLTDGLEEATGKVRAVAGRLASLEGKLHEITHPPAWVVYLHSTTREILVHTLDSAYPDEIPHLGGASRTQVFGADQRTEAAAYAEALSGTVGLPVRWCPTGIEVMNPDALRFDATMASAVSTLRSGVAGVTRNGSPALQHLDDRTLLAFMAVRRAAAASEDRRPSTEEARDMLAEYADALDALARQPLHGLDGFRSMLADVAGDARAYVARHDVCAALVPQDEEDARFLSAI